MESNFIYNGDLLEEMTLNGHKVSVEVAKRDALGHTIHEFYAIKSRTQEKLISGSNIVTINNKSILTNGNIDFYTKTESFSRTEVTNKLAEKVSVISVTTKPTSNINNNTIYYETSTNDVYLRASNKWFKLCTVMPEQPKNNGKYVLTCTKTDDGVEYNWENTEE